MSCAFLAYFNCSTQCHKEICYFFKHKTWTLGILVWNILNLTWADIYLDTNIFLYITVILNKMQFSLLSTYIDVVLTFSIRQVLSPRPTYTSYSTYITYNCMLGLLQIRVDSRFAPSQWETSLKFFNVWRASQSHINKYYENSFAHYLLLIYRIIFTFWTAQRSSIMTNV